MRCLLLFLEVFFYTNEKYRKKYQKNVDRKKYFVDNGDFSKELIENT